MKKWWLLAAALVFCGFGLSACKEEVPLETPGASTTLSTNKSPLELDAYSVAYAFLQKQTELTSYEIRTEGTTVANSAVSYTQQIENLEIKHGDEYYQAANSSSALVKMVHQSFTKGEMVAYRNAASGEIASATREDYKEIYGITPDDVGLGGYVVNSETLRYAERVEGESLTYRFVLDGEKAGINAKKQMKEFGSLKSYPTFSSLELLLTIEEDWTPVSLVTKATYDIEVAVLGKTACTQSITATYSAVNAEVSIPDSEAFNAAIGSTPSEVLPGETEMSPLMQVAEAFGQKYDEEEGLGLNVALSLNAYGEPILLEGTLQVKFDETAAETGLFRALEFRLELPLAPLGIPQGIGADLLVVRTAGGELLLSLGDDGGAGALCYAVGMEEMLASFDQLAGEGDAEALLSVLENALSIQQTENGYLLSLKPVSLALINTGYQILLNRAEAATEDAGLVRALLDTQFTAIEFAVECDADGAAEGIAVYADGMYRGTFGNSATANLLRSAAALTSLDYGTGAALSAELDPGILSDENAGWKLLTGGFSAKIYIQCEAKKLVSDPLGALRFRADIDCGNMAPISQLLQFAGGMLPADLDLDMLKDIASLSVYCVGDGTIRLAVFNTFGIVTWSKQVEQTDLMFALLRGGTEQKEEEQGQPLSVFGVYALLENAFATEKTEDGAELTLRPEYVALLSERYIAFVDELVASLAASAGEMGVLVKTFVPLMLGAMIDGMSIRIEEQDGELKNVSLLVTGQKLVSNADGTRTGDGTSFPLLSVSLTAEGEMPEGELDGDAEQVAAIAANQAAAEEFCARVDDAAELLWLDEQDAFLSYLSRLEREYDGLTDAQKAFVRNYDRIGTLKLLYAQLKHAAEEFLQYFDGTALRVLTEEEWTAINRLYDEGGTVSGATGEEVSYPAIGACSASLEYIGEERVASYREARAAHEGNV